MMILSIMILTFKLHFKPHPEPDYYYFEIINEAALLGVSYCLLTLLVINTE
jgi:hypothetical protein